MDYINSKKKGRGGGAVGNISCLPSLVIFVTSSSLVTEGHILNCFERFIANCKSLQVGGIHFLHESYSEKKGPLRSITKSGMAFQSIFGKNLFMKVIKLYRNNKQTNKQTQKTRRKSLKSKRRLSFFMTALVPRPLQLQETKLFCLKYALCSYHPQIWIITMRRRRQHKLTPMTKSQKRKSAEEEEIEERESHRKTEIERERDRDREREREREREKG